MLTKIDFQEIRKTLATVARKEDFEKFRVGVRNDLAQLKDDILKELVKIREDFVVVHGWGDKIEDHEERIGRLESCVQV